VSAIRGVAGLLILTAVVSITFVLSSRYSLGEEAATQLIRHYLKYQSSRRDAELYRSGTIDAQASKRFQEELGQLQTRYFNLGGGHLVLGESSRVAWMFVL
jgi:hypothetical protein